MGIAGCSAWASLGALHGRRLLLCMGVAGCSAWASLGALLGRACACCVFGCMAGSKGPQKAAELCMVAVHKLPIGRALCQLPLRAAPRCACMGKAAASDEVNNLLQRIGKVEYAIEAAGATAAARQARAHKELARATSASPPRSR
eukprot:175442-Chlamydomonas_euryale.AAC.1